MNTNDLRKILCWVLRQHKYRRLYKGESMLGTKGFEDDRARHRVCSRCGATRLAAKRKPKEKAE